MRMEGRILVLIRLLVLVVLALAHLHSTPLSTLLSLLSLILASVIILAPMVDVNLSLEPTTMRRL